MHGRAQDVRWPRLALRCAPAAADVETRQARQWGALKSCSALYVKMDLQHGPLTKLALPPPLILGKSTQSLYLPYLNHFESFKNQGVLENYFGLTEIILN